MQPNQPNAPTHTITLTIKVPTSVSAEDLVLAVAQFVAHKEPAWVD
jgi:hypothetical protein